MPDVQFLDGTGKSLAVTINPTLAQWQVDKAAKPAGWPVVTLRPGQRAQLRIAWHNWCGSPPPQTWRIVLGGGHGSFDAPGTTDAPPCNGPGQPSTLDLGPFEPSV